MPDWFLDKTSDEWRYTGKQSPYSCIQQLPMNTDEKLGKAIRAYRAQEVSISRAAEIAGITTRDFLACMEESDI
jgi:hypothetical protein